MTKAEFLDILRSRLGGIPQLEIDDIVADYTEHFTDGMAAGRSEEDIAAALGDPVRLARELRAEAGFRRWEAKRTPANLAAVLFGVIALIAVDFIVLLPALAGLLLFTCVAGLVVMGLCIAGFALVGKVLFWDGGFFAFQTLLRALGAISFLGFGIGLGALLMMMIDWVVRMMTRFARLHYTLLDHAKFAAA